MTDLSLSGPMDATDRPLIERLGTIECELVECTPVVFNDRVYHGRLVITYSWGNQGGIEHLAEAVYHGTLAQFLRSWWPEG